MMTLRSQFRQHLLVVQSFAVLAISGGALADNSAPKEAPPSKPAPQIARPTPQAPMQPNGTYQPRPQIAPGQPSNRPQIPGQGRSPAMPDPRLGQRQPQPSLPARPTVFGQIPSGRPSFPGIPQRATQLPQRPSAAPNQTVPNSRATPRAVGLPERHPLGIGRTGPGPTGIGGRRSAVATTSAVGTVTGTTTVISTTTVAGGPVVNFVVPMPPLQPVGTTCVALGPTAVLWASGYSSTAFVPADCQQVNAVMGQMDDAATGQPISWSDPTTGKSGSVTPTDDPVPDANGRICRSYTSTTAGNGESSAQQYTGLTCRNSDGDWSEEPNQ